MTVYPNPANGPVNISIRSDVREKAVLTIWNELGQMVYSCPVQLEAGRQTLPLGLDVASLPSGIYSVNISSGSQRHTARLVAG